MRYLTESVSGIGGINKHVPEDFRVDEIPLEPFSGEGKFVLLRVRKRQLTTHEAVSRIARQARIRETDIGFAGIKDSRAVTTQWISVPARAWPSLRSARIDGMEILEHTRHGTPLRPGRLTGNAFELIVREVDRSALERAREVLQTLEQRGVPNLFGPQRFGVKNDSDLIGCSLLREDFSEALRLFLGAPSPLERDRRIHRARRQFEDGELERALESFPHWLRNERRVLRHYLKTDNPAAAMAKLPKNLRLLFISAHQSRLFNRCLEQRMPDLDQVMDGDVLYDHESGEAQPAAHFSDASERVRDRRFSPAGPLFGPGLVRATGPAGALEDEVFAADGTDPELEWAPFPDLHLKGERRPYRILLREVEVDMVSEGLRLRFALPRGAYATSVLAEVQKADTPT